MSHSNFYIAYYDNVKHKIKDKGDIKRNKLYRSSTVFQNGELIELPNLIKSNGDQYWFVNGVKHRHPVVDNHGKIISCEPAVIYSNGSKCWYKYGKRHRDNDFPAVIQSNGHQDALKSAPGFSLDWVEKWCETSQ